MIFTKTIIIIIFLLNLEDEIDDRLFLTFVHFTLDGAISLKKLITSWDMYRNMCWILFSDGIWEADCVCVCVCVDGALSIDSTVSFPCGSWATDVEEVNPKAAFVPDRLVLFLSRSDTLIILRTTSCSSLFIHFLSSPFRTPFPSSHSLSLSSWSLRNCFKLLDMRRTSIIYSLRHANKVILAFIFQDIRR